MDRTGSSFFFFFLNVYSVEIISSTVVGPEGLLLGILFVLLFIIIIIVIYNTRYVCWAFHTFHRGKAILLCIFLVRFILLPSASVRPFFSNEMCNSLPPAPSILFRHPHDVWWLLFSLLLSFKIALNPRAIVMSQHLFLLLLCMQIPLGILAK